jgi:NadR type nicotinamide-nucleotide adenylyltransferase
MIRKIVITGPESTGKSTLAEGLARHYKTVWVREYARRYLEVLKRPYEKHDLVEIAKGQIRAEEDQLGLANGMLFCDTDLTVLKIWSQHKYGTVHPFILENLRNRSYDLYLLPYIDLPWKYDPQREHPHLREYLFDAYENELHARGIDYVVLKGSHVQRISTAIKTIDRAAENW